MRCRRENRERVKVSGASNYSRDHRNVAESFGAENTAIAFDFGRRAERFGVVVGELDRGLAFNRGYLADQTDWVKVAAGGGITAAEIVGQKSSPTRAETNAPARGPLLAIEEIGGAAEVVYRGANRGAVGGAARQRPAKIGVQAEDVIDVECVGRDDELFMRIATALLEPLDIFIACDVGILAVDALARPIGCPVGGMVEKLGGSKSIRQHDAESAFIGALPQLEDAVLRSFQAIVIGCECGEDHGDLVRVGSDGFKIVLVGEEGIRGSNKGAGEICCHGDDHVFLPEEAVRFLIQRWESANSALLQNLGAPSLNRFLIQGWDTWTLNRPADRKSTRLNSSHLGIS